MEHKFTNFTTAMWNGSKPTVNRRSTDSQSQDHRNHTPISKALKYAAMILMVLTLGVGNAWGDETAVAYGFENNKVDESGYTQSTGDGNRSISSTITRTGSYSLEQDNNNTSAKNCKVTVPITSDKNKYVHVIAYLKKSPSATGNVTLKYYSLYQGGDLGKVSPNSNLGTDWTRITTKGNKNNSTTYTTLELRINTQTATKGDKYYIDDVVMYTTTGDAKTDLKKPGSATITAHATDALTWTSGTDVADDDYDATGVQKTLIFKKTSGTASGLTLNDQGVYSLTAKDGPSTVGDWTLVAVVDPSTESYTTGLTAGHHYAIVHRDLAYNYSNPAYVTISGGGDTPTCEATADAGADKNTTVGVGVAMAATAAGEGYTGAWSIKSGSPSTATSQLSSTSAYNATFTPSTYGTYTLVWTVTDNSDGTCSASDEATVTVPAPTHSIAYTSTKDMDNSANPTSYTEGVGVTSFAKLRHAVGYDFTGWSPSSISSSATTNQTIDAQWTANAVAEGTGSLTYALAFGSGTVTTSSITRVNGALYDATDVSVAHTSFVSGGESVSKGCSGKLTTTSSKSNSNYVEVTFKVADGYTFTPTEVRVQGIAVSNDKTIEVELKDNAATPNSKSVSGTLTAVKSPTEGGYTVTLDFDATGEVALEGTVTAKIYAYGNTDHWRIGTPFVVTGTVAEVPAPDPSTKRIYMKCGDTWCNLDPKFFVHSWGSADDDAELTQMTGCETDVYYADIPSGNTSLLFTRQKNTTTEIIYEGDDFWGKSQNITIGDNDLFTCTGWTDGLATFSGSTYAAPTYTISFAGNGNTDGSMSNITSLACNANRALTANAFVKAGYSFAHWTADVTVNVGGEPISIGSAIANEATIQNISSDIALTAQWTQEVPTSVNITGSWRYFPGQTISLTANPVGGTSDFTYQWQKYVTSDWEDIDGETAATYSKASCTISDCGSYRCVVSKLGGSVASDGYDVHIFTLEGDYSGGSDWTAYNIAQTSGTVGAVAVTLNASSLFEFGIKDNFNNDWYRNTNFIIDNWTNEGFGKGSGNCRLFTGPAGSYTFTVDINHVSDNYVEVSLDYPNVTHPAAGYAYFKKWDTWDGYYIHWWYNDGSDHPLTEWGSDVQITNETTICETDYIYFPVLAIYNQLIVKEAAGEATDKTGNLSSVGSSGKYFDFTNDNAWNTFPSYTITFNSNGGSAVAEQNVGCGGTATEPDPAPTRLNYDFEGWQLNGVDYNFATVVSEDITLDAVWTRKAVAGIETDITLVSTSAAIGSTSPLTDVYYGNADWTYTGNAGISTGGAMFGTPSSKKWVGFTIPANYTATVEATCKKDADHDRHCVLVTEAERAGQAGDATFLFDISVNTDDLTATSASIEQGAYCVGSTSGGLTINSVIVHLTYLPTVKLKVLGSVTQTISITVGEKLGEIFASGSLPTLDLPGYTFNGWKNEVGDAAVNDNTVTSGSMVIYADLEAHEYDVTLENGETDGAATVHYGDETLTITTDVTGEAGDVLDGFYTAATEGTKVADDEGNLVANVTGFTDVNGKWIKESDATLYTIWIPYVPSSDATLSDLTVGGTTIAGFDAATISYDVELPFGTFVAPTVDGTATDTKAKSVVVTQASSANGDATVVVTAEDNSTKTYTVHFSVVASKNIELVWATDKQRCDATTPSAVVKSNNAAVSTYINQITFTGGGEEGSSSLNVGKKTGNMLTLAAKAGFAIKDLSFYGKIESADTKLEYSLDGGSTWNDLASTSGDDACYSDVFTDEEVHTLCMRSAGSKGFWIRNMQLTMIQACTPKTIAWTAEPAAEYEVGASVDPIAASANNGTVTYASNDGDVIAVNSSNGALTVSSLGTVTLSASVPAGDGTTYCATAANIEKTSINTYYLVTFDKQNGESAIENKYYKNGEAIALPSTPSYSGYTFQGWFDAPSGGTEVTSAITPTASRTVYAQWEATCEGPMITMQSGSRTYFVGREAATLVGEASAANEGELTYTWYSCDDELKTNPVALPGAPTPSTAVAGTQYYYFTVTEAGCDVVASSDVIVITVVEKDPVCIIKATPTSGTEATADGAYKGNAFFKGRASDYKLNSSYDYVGVELASGYTFLATDKVVLNQTADLGTDDIKKFYVYNEEPASGKTCVTITNASPVKGDNWFDMPEGMVGESALYIGRKDASCNPTVGYVAVYRTMMPELMAITIDDRAGELDALAENTFNVTIPYESDLASLTVVPTIARNAAHATTPEAVITNDGAWVLGNNTYRVMDKDGDYTDYTIALTRDVLKYTVSYNMHGGAPAIDDELVVAGGKIAAAPADPTREDYIFQGWSLTDGGDIIDIANVTIDEDKVFHAVWASDGGIKLLDGSTVNTTNFITGVTATTVSISGDNYDCVAFGGTVSNVNASNMKNLNSHVTYNATTTQTKIRLSLYNSNGSKRTIYVKGVVEGTDDIVDLAAIELNGNEKKTTEYIEFNNAKNRSIYIFVSSNAGDIKILQVKVMEEGAALKKAGEIGYSLNMNKGRMFGAKDATIAAFEGLSYTLNGDYTPLSSAVLKMKSASITFTTTVPVQLSVTTATTDKTYYITRGSAGTDNPNTSSAKLNLAVPGTWYITAGSSEVTITGISFDYPQVEITENATDAAIIAGADVTVKDGKELTLDNAHTIHDLIVEEGGKVTLNNTLTVENLYLEAQAGASGQVLGATNVTASAVYMDVTFFKGATELDETTAGRWYMISAPFDVNLNGGFSLTDGTPMTFGTSDDANIFDLFEYDGAKRASGASGWKRAQGKMNAGRACLIGFNPGQKTTIRLKAASTTLGEPTSITLNEYAGEEADANWNGVANPTLHYTDLSKDVQTYNNEDGENGRKYIAYSASSTSFVVGTAFFVQETGTIDLSAASHSEFRAPQRQANERYEACVRIFRQEATDFADQMYVRASENATNEYEQGHDMITWNESTASTALIWAENYGKRLSIEEAPVVNKKASYKLGIFAPVAGEYRIEMTNPSEDATLYLTKNGRVFWNLTMGACELDLNQGQNNEYGLVLRAEAPAVTTGMDEIHSEAGVQKLIIDENVFILRGEQLFDMTGKAVK